MNRINLKELFIQLRNGLSFCFSWLVICTMIISLLNKKASIPTELLLKIFVISLWAVLCFIVCFKDVVFRKKRFVFRLTLFYVMFVPVEMLMFFLMGLFKGNGSVLEWVAFFGIIAGLYASCVLIDWVIGKKQGKIYTDQLLAYNERRAYELSGKNK